MKLFGRRQRARDRERQRRVTFAYAMVEQERSLADVLLKGARLERDEALDDVAAAREQVALYRDRWLRADNECDRQKRCADAYALQLKAAGRVPVDPVPLSPMTVWGAGVSFADTFARTVS